MQLVADIGGTNARLASLEAGRLHTARSYKNAAFQGFDELVTQYLSDTAQTSPKRLVAAIAGPVQGNEGRLTNLPWHVSGPDMSRRFAGADVTIVNDLTALGYAALDLGAVQLERLAPGLQGKALRGGRNALVVGIGTGFNVSPVVESEGQRVCPAVEVGHASLPVAIARKLNGIKPALADEFQSIESLFSGAGRRKFLSLVCEQNVERATPYLAAFGAAENARFDQALDDYAALVAALLVDLRLTYGPENGIFLAGGVARSTLDHGRCRFLQGVFADQAQFLSGSPAIYLIKDDSAALLGCAKLCARH
ncbi:glucokinase [Thalassococcus lentus]|uniref:Glucokinase n=1 Tax=Thalassococcus lentus TaxID=1210524 RepID=A0ABT4XY55_9RHOB|nr:glucokinase [Thalassococcus lentus]MDA7426748.1 glucokinase [Thalassococcus lentus]